MQRRSGDAEEGTGAAKARFGMSGSISPTTLHHALTRSPLPLSVQLQHTHLTKAKVGPGNSWGYFPQLPSHKSLAVTGGLRRCLSEGRQIIMKS